MRKLFNIFLLTAIMVSSNILTSCGGKERYSNYDDTSKNANSIVETNTEDRHSIPITEDSSNPKSEGYVGTYEFTDEANNEWILTLNSDKTATIHKKNNNHESYGSWDELNFMDDTPIIRFRDETPTIWFKSGEERSQELQIYEGFLYERWDAAQAKNPRKRLPITKIK